jgi:hypothetical protein
MKRDQQAGRRVTADDATGALGRAGLEQPTATINAATSKRGILHRPR